MYQKSLEKPYSRELFSIQDTVQDMCGTHPPGVGKLALAMHTSAKLAVIVIEERGKSPHVLVVPM